MADLKDYISDNRLHVAVRPNSKKTEIVGFDDEKGLVKINLKAPPEKGKANLELVRFLTRELKKKITVVSGLRSKSKTIRIG